MLLTSHDLGHRMHVFVRYGRFHYKPVGLGVQAHRPGQALTSTWSSAGRHAEVVRLTPAGPGPSQPARTAQ